MKQDPVPDLGTVQIHKKVIAEIIGLTINEIKGVKLLGKTIFQKISEYIGRECFPGIEIKLGRNQEVKIVIKVIISYGFNISDIARQIQDRVKEALDRNININVKSINVNVVGIERGQK